MLSIRTIVILFCFGCFVLGLGVFIGDVKGAEKQQLSKEQVEEVYKIKSFLKTLNKEIPKDSVFQKKDIKRIGDFLSSSIESLGYSKDEYSVSIWICEEGYFNINFLIKFKTIQGVFQGSGFYLYKEFGDVI